jgi:hypothetical protein
VGRVGEQCAEGDDERAAQLVARGQQLGAELPPPHVGLDPTDQDHVAVQVRRGRDGDLAARPGDPAEPVGVRTDNGPVDLEVVELLGVDRPDDPRLPHVHEVVDHSGRCLRGVVPALEGRDHHRVHQVRRLLDLDHSRSLARGSVTRGFLAR